MDITIHAKDGSVVSQWQDVVKADLVPSTPPAIVFYAGQIKSMIIGVQTVDNGMYAKYSNVNWDAFQEKKLITE